MNISHKAPVESSVSPTNLSSPDELRHHQSTPAKLHNVTSKASKAAACNDQESNRRPQPLSKPKNKEDNLQVWQRGIDEHAAFRVRRPKVGAKDRNPGVDGDVNADPDADTDAAVSRLLRSASANYKVVEEANYASLAPLPHPINSVSSRSTSALTITPTPLGSVQTRGSYRVTVHKRQQLSATVFPNAYPPITPRRPGVAHTSTPNLLATLTAPDDVTTDASTSTPALFDPRKVPVTPRDASRLKCLRQDPSVASLVQLYDDHGRIAENAFTTTPAPPRRRMRARRSRRKSTFSELLGCDGADLQWAESCIAKQGEIRSNNSISNASTSSFSSTDTPPLDSPATSTFNDADLDRVVTTPAPGLARDPSASTVTGQAKKDGFSSLVVELSVATSAASAESDDRPGPYLGPYRRSGDKNSGKEKELPKGNITERERRNSSATVDSQDRTMGSKILRKPSHRASQVFDFIAERRDRRKSQELLQGSAILTSDMDRGAALLDKRAGSTLNNRLTVQSTALSRARSPSSSLGLSGSSVQHHPKSAPSHRLGFDLDPVPASSSQVTLRAVSPAPLVGSRHRSNTCSQATGAVMHHASRNASTSNLPSTTGGFATMQRPPVGSTAALSILQLEREREKEKRRDAARVKLLDQQMLAATSTPHPSKVARFKKVSFARRRHDGRDSERAAFGEVTNGNAGQEGDYLERTSFERFAASLDARTQQMQKHMQMKTNGKENANKVVTRRRGATIDLGLTRAATMTLVSTPTNKHMHDEVRAPQTPNRSQSLRLLEPGQGSSSELSPQTTQLMADLRARRARSQSRVERGRHAMNVV
ncbi:hypothetical protein ACEPAG_4333 [Sanghuangporus baumii]